MYYYETTTQNGVVLEKSTVPYTTPEQASDAAMDSLASMYVESWPVDIDLYKEPPGDSPRGICRSSTVWEDGMQQHALKRIEEANRPALQEIIRLTVQSFEDVKAQYDRGLITPLDFTKSQEGNWLQARYDIENKLQA